MKEKLIKWLAGLLGSGIMILLLFGTFAVVALVGGNVMRLFGFRYDSVGQLLLYFLLGELTGPASGSDQYSAAQGAVSNGKVDRRQGNLLYIPMDTLFTIAAFWVADGLMASVSTTGLSLCILGFGTALITQPIKKDD